MKILQSLRVWPGSYIAGSICTASGSHLAVSESFSQAPGEDIAAVLMTATSGANSLMHCCRPSPLTKSTCTVEPALESVLVASSYPDQRPASEEQ